jgi:hypothetical protein
VGHGTHWEAVLTNLEEDFATAIDLGIQKGNVIGRRHHDVWSGPFGKMSADVTLIQGTGESGLAALGIVVSANSETYLHSAFPLAAKGIVQNVRVLEIHESSFGLEACITAQIGDARINFFEPYYALQSDLYRRGAELDVSLSGIVYLLSVPDRGQKVMHPEIGETHLDGAAMLLPIAQPTPSALAANGFGLSYVLAAQDGPGLDDYSFRGPVKRVESQEFLGRAAWQMTATVIRLENGERDVNLNLYVLDDKFRDGRRPSEGGDVTGVLWLQGLAIRAELGSAG